MRIIRAFQNHLRIFHLVGQSLIFRNQSQNERSIFQRFIEYVPVVFVLWFHLLSVYIEVSHHYEGTGDITEKTALTIYFIRMTALVSTQLIVIIQMIKNPNGIRHILEIVNRLCFFMKNRMDVMLSFHKFKKRYLRRSLVVAGVHLFASLLKIFIVIGSSNPLKMYQFITLVRSIFHACGKIHVLFYIELFNWLFQIGINFIDTQFEKAQSGSFMILIGDEDKFTDILKLCKYVFFKLWKTMRHIEHYFGWFLISICLYSFIDILCSLCWLFVICYGQGDSLKCSSYHSLVIISFYYYRKLASHHT